MERKYRWNGKFLYVLLAVCYNIQYAKRFSSQFLLREAARILSDALSRK
jgi:hypothetical protein